MKAVILVGGEATRLRPLTCYVPKGMVPVLNTPFLEQVIRYLALHGIRDVILAQSCLFPSMQEYFGDGSRWGVRLSSVIEETLLGTAGAVKNAEEHLDERFLVLNGDIFTDLDITAMLAFHQERKARVTIALTLVDDPSAYGLVETDAHSRILRFIEKPRPEEVTTNMINAGVYVVEPEVLSLIPPQVNYSFERQVFPLLLGKDLPLYAYPSSGYWIDIGTPEKYFQLNQDLLLGKSRWFASVFPAQGVPDVSALVKGPVMLGEHVRIASGVRLTGPAVIGAGCRLGEGAVIERSLLWNDVEVQPGAIVKDSIIANNCRLGAGSQVVGGSVLGSGVSIPAGFHLAPGSKLWPGEAVAQG